MGMKFGVLVGLGVGYVLGSRAGREHYDKIREHASKLRRYPMVAKPLDSAADKVAGVVRNGGEMVTDKVADAIKERLFGAPRTADSASATPTQPAAASDEIIIDVVDDSPTSR